MKHQHFEIDAFFHLYNRGNNKTTIFKEADNYRYFLNLVTKYLLPICKVWSYCLLPNHFHFVIKIKSEKDMSEAIKNGKQKLHQPFSNLFNAYTKAFNKKYNRSGSLFQEHLKRIKIENEIYLKQLIVYVNTNSEDHNIAPYTTYAYSSYQSLVSDKFTHLQRQEVIALFDGVTNFKATLQQKIDIENLKHHILE